MDRRLCHHVQNLPVCVLRYEQLGGVFPAVPTTRILMETESDDELLIYGPNFPWLKMTGKDFRPPYTDCKVHGSDSPYSNFVVEHLIPTSKSHGLMNCFYELEPCYSDFSNLDPKPKTWSIGPFCLAQPPKTLPSPTRSHHGIMDCVAG